MEDGAATHGQEDWNAFYESTLQGKSASITVAHYGTLDPEKCDSAYYETFNQDYPYLNTYSLSYDGNVFTLSFVNGADLHSRTYEYLMKFETAIPATISAGEQKTAMRYVLVHDDELTWGEITEGMFSSQLGAYIDHYSIYTEYKQ